MVRVSTANKQKKKKEDSEARQKAAQEHLKGTGERALKNIEENKGGIAAKGTSRVAGTAFDPTSGRKLADLQAEQRCIYPSKLEVKEVTKEKITRGRDFVIGEEKEKENDIRGNIHDLFNRGDEEGMKEYIGRLVSGAPLGGRPENTTLTGTVPIGIPGLGVAAGAARGVGAAALGAGRTAAKIPKFANVFKKTSDIKAAAASNRIGTAYGQDPTKILSAITKSKMKQEIAKAASPASWKPLKTALKFGATVITLEAMIPVWYALDNMISGTSILLRDTAQNLKFSDKTPEQIENAQRIYQEAQENVDFWKSTVTRITGHNPYLIFGLGKMYRQGLEDSQFIIDENRAIVDDIATGAFEQREAEAADREKREAEIGLDIKAPGE